MRAAIAVLAVMLSAAPALRAQESPAPVRLTMSEAVRRAVEYGEEVRFARSGVDQAHSQVIQARADALPQVRLGLTYQRTFYSPFASGGTAGPGLPPFDPDTTLPLDRRIRYLEQEYPNVLERQIGGLFSATPFGRPNTWTGNITVSQLLFQGPKVGAALAGARAYERAAREQLEETRQDIAYRTRLAYLNALFAERLLGIAEGGKALADEQLRRVELNQRVGAAADYDLLRAQVEAANQEPRVIGARNDRDIALLQLRALINLPASTPIELDAGVLAAADSLVEPDWPALRTEAARRSSIAAAEAGVDVARQAVRVYRGDYWPAFRLNMYFGQQSYPDAVLPGSWRRDWNASLSVSVPLFDGMRTRGQVSLARAQLSQAELQLAQARETVDLEVERARSELVRARSLLDARRQTVTQAARAQHLASVRFANGITTQLEVSDARLALQQAQVNEAQASRDYLVGLAALERALGRPVPVRTVERRAATDGGAATNGQNGVDR